jgi:hypothetical protein
MDRDMKRDKDADTYMDMDMNLNVYIYAHGPWYKNISQMWTTVAQDQKPAARSEIDGFPHDFYRKALLLLMCVVQPALEKKTRLKKLSDKDIFVCRLTMNC